ncbi:MAG: ABC transporter permease subunit [Acidobacteriota bacterium]|nr:ABC transporter permease subunit [Acidobacteriota bacterium]
MGRLGLHVAWKELREAVRDRRSLFSGLFYGVWGPLVMALALTAVARDRHHDGPITVPVEGGSHAPALIGFVEARGVDVQLASATAVEDVRAGTVPAVIQVGDDFASEFEAAKPARITLVYDGSRAASRRAAERVREVLGEYAARARDTRLVLRGVSPAVAGVLEIGERDLSTAASRASGALATLPMFVLLAAFVGGMSVAADITAGERERASLESLLITPASRWALVTGKWLATALVALTTLTVTLVVCHLVLRHPRVQAVDLPVGLSAGEAVRMWGVLVPLACLTSAVQLLIGFLARTYKEAQTHLSLLVFLPMIPGFLLAFGALEPALWMTLTPVIGQHLLVAQVVRGQAMAPTTVLAVSLVSAAAAAAALAIAVRVIGAESVLRRTGA